jgi:hypothetical protein
MEDLLRLIMCCHGPSSNPWTYKVVELLLSIVGLHMHYNLQLCNESVRPARLGGLPFCCCSGPDVKAVPSSAAAAAAQLTSQVRNPDIVSPGYQRVD